MPAPAGNRNGVKAFCRARAPAARARRSHSRFFLVDSGVFPSQNLTPNDILIVRGVVYAKRLTAVPKFGP